MEDIIDFDSLILSSSSYARKEIQSSLKDQYNRTYKFYMILLSQLKGLEPRYELYLLLTALEDPFVNNVDTRKEDLDFLYLRLFNTA